MSCPLHLLLSAIVPQRLALLLPRPKWPRLAAEHPLLVACLGAAFCRKEVVPVRTLNDVRALCEPMRRLPDDCRRGEGAACWQIYFGNVDSEVLLGRVGWALGQTGGSGEVDFVVIIPEELYGSTW